MDLTQLLQRINGGDRDAERELYDRVYDELRARAHRLMARQRPGHSLETAGLINEVYLRLNRGQGAAWENSDHFFGVASRAMRSVLTDHARRRAREKRKPDGDRVPLDDLLLAYEERGVNMLDLDAALERLADKDPQEARIVELRFFAGLALPEVARVLGVPLRSVERDWRHARLWLHRELS